MARTKEDPRAGKPVAGEFETILGRLEEIVTDLEAGKHNLEDSLGLFEEGVRLSREGHAILDRAESRVETLLESGETEAGVKGGPAPG